MKIGFIGCGNMGSALAVAVSKCADTELLLCDTDTERAQVLASRVGGKVASAEEIARTCKFIYMAVKPYLVGDVLDSMADALKQNRDGVIVSMAAGVEIFTLERHVDEGRAVIRIMPNTPVAIGEGIVAFSVNSEVKREDAELFKKAMAASGSVEEIPERLIDAESALAGCGPAFTYMFIDALADGAVRCGLDRQSALKYAAATVKGAADMVLTSGKHPGKLKDEVCSPGGSTIEGVLALERASFRAGAADAVIQAYEKTKAMGK